MRLLTLVFLLAFSGVGLAYNCPYVVKCNADDTNESSLYITKQNNNFAPCTITGTISLQQRLRSYAIYKGLYTLRYVLHDKSNQIVCFYQNVDSSKDGKSGAWGNPHSFIDYVSQGFAPMNPNDWVAIDGGSMICGDDLKNVFQSFSNTQAQALANKCTLKRVQK